MSVSGIMVFLWSINFRWCPIYTPTSNGNFCQRPWKFVHSSNDGHPTCCLYFSLYTELQECISSLNVGTFISKSADSIWYDGYDLSHKTKTITVFLNDRVWCRPTVWWNNSRTSRTISIKLSEVPPVISINEYRLFAGKVNISPPFHTLTFSPMFSVCG